MGYFKDGEYVESDFYEEPEYKVTYDDEGNSKKKLNPDIIDAEGNNLGKADSNAKANAEAWRQHEERQLAKKEDEKKGEAEWRATEGKGARRQAKLSFGNEDALRAEGKESERSQGRFDTNRLTL